MAEVIIEGVFMGSSLKTTEFDGKKTTRLEVDIYQKDSTSNQKTVTVKTDNLELADIIRDNYDFGSLIKIKAVVNAYKNQAYFRLMEVV